MCRKRMTGYYLHHTDLWVFHLWFSEEESPDQRLYGWWQISKVLHFCPKVSLHKLPEMLRVYLLAANVSLVPWCQLTLPRSEPPLIGKYGGYCQFGEGGCNVCAHTIHTRGDNPAKMGSPQDHTALTAKATIKSYLFTCKIHACEQKKQKTFTVRKMGEWMS